MRNPTGLKRVILSIKETRSELDFQIQRLKAVNSDVEAEREHLEDLERGYKDSFRYLGILLRYQEGRVRRLSESAEEVATL